MNRIMKLLLPTLIRLNLMEEQGVLNIVKRKFTDGYLTKVFGIVATITTISLGYTLLIDPSFFHPESIQVGIIEISG